jgi:hypothetical protein
LATATALAAAAHAEPPTPGLAADEAAAIAVDVAAAFPRLEDTYAERGKRTLVSTSEHPNSRGAPAWLTIFRYASGELACVWVWAETEGPWPIGVEQVPSLVEGRPGDVGHEACLAELKRRGLVTPEDTVGTDFPRPVPSEPALVSPFGVVPAGVRLTDVVLADEGVFMSNEPVRSPLEAVAGTIALVGHVVDNRAQSTREVGGARVTTAPATFARNEHRPARVPPALETFTDRHGFFAFVDLPVLPLGYDIRVEAPGYPPLVDHDFDSHDVGAAGDLYFWDVDVGPLRDG